MTVRTGFASTLVLGFLLSNAAWAKSNAYEVLRELIPLTMTSIEVIDSEDGVILRGEATTLTELGAVFNACDAVRGTYKVFNVVQLGEKARTEFILKVEGSIGHSGVSVVVRNQALYLEGVVMNDFEADRATEIAKSFLIAPATPADTLNVVSAGTPPVSSNFTGPVNSHFYNRNGFPVVLVDMLRIQMPPAKTALRKKAGTTAAAQ